ncbi:EAL domain-containing protein [Lentibacillus salinarum]|uniref:EAL domain-containing protein n=1 Tax=Lentibacillus salinarum TaxID=446820 RepID=A0ABW3ZQK4_9BACI
MDLKLDITSEENDFYHVIQPVINLITNDVYGYEVLLRSQQVQNPKLLFDNAREHNQLVNVDISSIFKAFETLNQGGVPIKDKRILVNVFPSTLVDTSFYYHLQQLKSYLGSVSNNVVIEINEAEKEMELFIVKEVAQEIRKDGFLIALNDLGKGEWTLRSILEINPDIAKIDRYFAKDLAESPKKQKALKFMLMLLREDAEVIVEGFESEPDLQKAKELGVPYGQGYLLGKPKPIKYYMPGVYPSEYRRLWRLQDG